jgi:hypothetical protein
MRRVFSVLLFLIAGLFVLTGIAFSQSKPLQPLPLARSVLSHTVPAVPTSQADLERAGYTLVERSAESRPADGRQRSYAFGGQSGSSAVLVDSQYPPLGPSAVLVDDEYPQFVCIGREVVFDITVMVKEGKSASDMPGIAPKLIAEMKKAVSEDPAIVAGLGYLATAAAPGVAPELLQTAVIHYLWRYQQPSTPLHEECAGCGWQDGFGDAYISGPDMLVPLNGAGPEWKIAGIRHYLDGDSTFRVQVTARIPRSEP